LSVDDSDEYFDLNLLGAVVSHPFAGKKANGWGTQHRRRIWAFELSDIGQRGGGSGHSGGLAGFGPYPETLSFQWLSARDIWHGKCYIRV
jgi:hypothetical protein